MALTAQQRIEVIQRVLLEYITRMHIPEAMPLSEALPGWLVPARLRYHVYPEYEGCLLEVLMELVYHDVESKGAGQNG